VDADVLVDIVENPRSPVGQRLGAALALTQFPDDFGNESARRSPTAHPRGGSLERQSARAHRARTRDRGTLDDATYERALEAVSRQCRENPAAARARVSSKAG
jgi:hypothetical protein